MFSAAGDSGPAAAPRASIHKTRGDAWLTVKKEWPKRLLYVPAMTSVARAENDSFLNPETLELDVRPRYNILSYTWGRWRTENEKAIAIEGTKWNIPAVLPQHFTVPDFDRVLRYVGAQGGVKYVWVDVACINQGRKNPEDIAEGADQVGKQMSIFSQASNAYIWLCGTTAVELERTLADGMEAHLNLNCELDDIEIHGALTWSNRTGLPIRELPPQKEQIVLGSLESIENTMCQLLRDKWFSSLWTLQESVLRRDAVLLAHEGTPILAAADQQTLVTLAILANSYRTLLGDLDRYLLWTMLAFMACNNPNIPYSLARYRECKEEEDRMYGVMQVYGFRLGKSVKPHLKFGLDELSVQFAKTLNQQYPVIAQMFIHTVVPERGRSWRITPECDVPEELSVYDPLPADNTAAPRITSEALIRGDARASFPDVDIYYDFGDHVYRFPGLDQNLVPDPACEIKIVVDDNLNAQVDGYGWPIAEMEETLHRSRGHLYLDATNYSGINFSQGLKYDGHVVFQGLRRDDGYTRQALSSQLKMIGILRNEGKSYSSPETLASKYSDKWSTLRGEWPRRLLHIPTMTSVERSSGDIYKGVKRPKYNILSYTWGRWEARNPKPDRRLPVSGVSWKIPVVDCFTQQEFHRAILKMEESAPFAWIDVVCIDQENYAVKMDEIGRQAGIFANAHRVYVWLWTLDRISMESNIINLIRHNSFTGSENNRDWEKTVERIHDTVKVIFEDWWFSSLWTLQESVLRQDALLLCREGILLKELVDLAQPKNPMLPTGLTPGYKETPSSGLGTLSHLAETVFGLHNQLNFSKPSRALQQQGLRDAILKCLQQTGYTSPPTSNPNVQYAAAKHRKTMREEDRIYGIMAIYGIKVGAAAPGADPKRKYTFVELENEFVSALNAYSPLLGQMFVHTKKPRAGRTWQITQSSRIPVETLANYDHHYPAKNCSIFANPRGANFALLGGDITPMHQMLKYWKACEGPDPTPPGGFQALWFELDDYVSQEHPSIPRPYEHLSWSGPSTEFGHYLLNITYRTATSLMDVFGVEQVSVLRLGTREGDRFQQPLLYGLVVSHERGNWKHCKRLAKVDTI
ncbi:hypothetical protein diail_7939 [Diaporthe ilicicola]|nr:hypothetical protein diail_7939 [Diaporthe ilicicola]